MEIELFDNGPKVWNSLYVCVMFPVRTAGGLAKTR